MGLERHSFHEKRIDDRVPVFHRTRATDAEGQSLALVIVDLSTSGLMARCDLDLAPDMHIRVTLPVIGVRTARVRWALGGRIGCAFAPALTPDDYYALLASLTQTACDNQAA